MLSNFLVAIINMGQSTRTADATGDARAKIGVSKAPKPPKPLFAKPIIKAEERDDHGYISGTLVSGWHGKS